jgi:hypothetical protein
VKLLDPPSKLLIIIWARLVCSHRQLLANAAIATSRLASQVFYAFFEPKGQESDDRGSRRVRAYHLALI